MRYIGMRRAAIMALVLLLIVTGFPVYPTGNTSAAAGGETAESFVRIKNMYTGDYLTAAEGKVAYGSPVETDRSSHWLAEEHNGKQRLKNRETGLYMNVEGREGHLSPVGLAAAKEEPAFEWFILNAVTDGHVVMQSGADSSNYIHIQDSTGFAQASGIPLNWGTIQWKLEPVTEYVRLKNSYTGDYLMAFDNGTKTGYGQTPESNPASHWAVEERDGAQRIRNRETGTYMSVLNWTTHTSPVELLAIDDNAGGSEWRLLDAATPGLKVIQHGGNENHYIHVEDKTGYAQASSIPPNWGTVQWAVEVVTATEPYQPEQEGPAYVRIKNSWLELYLYEENGKLLYGNVPARDEAGQWLIVQDGDYQRIRNRASGHYISLQGVTDERTAVAVAGEAGDGATERWVIDNLNTAGAKLIHSPNSDGTYLHVEKKLGHAQYGSVPAEWSSPKWLFVVVGDGGPAYVRLQNDYTGKLLYEEDGKVKYGDPAFEDPSSHWLLSDAGGGLTRMQNRLTGHYMNVEGMSAENDPHLLPLASTAVEESWTSAKWTVTEPAQGLFVFRNGYRTNQVIHVQDGTGYAQSSDIPSDWGSARWRQLPAPELLPVTIPGGYVRLKNAGAGSYLYENENGVILYGSLEENDGRSHWLIVEGADHEADSAVYVIVNRETGHRMSSPGDEPFLIGSADSGDDRSSEQWRIEPAPDGVKALIRSESAPLEYVHVKDRAGYAQQSLQSIESGDLQWTLEPAPEESMVPSPDSSAEAVTTGRMPDRRLTQIIHDDRALTADEDGLRLELATNVPAEERPQVWQLWDEQGYKLIRHAESGRFLMYNPEELTVKLADYPASVFPVPSGFYWQVTERSGDVTIGNAGSPDRLLSVNGTSLMLEGGAVSGPGENQLFRMRPVRTDVVLEAEEAFLTGGAAGSVEARGYSGSGFVQGFDESGDSAVFTVYADVEGTYEAVLRYANGAKTHGALNVTVNGLGDQLLRLPSGPGWDEWREQNVALTLRRGLNTVTFERVGKASAPLLLDRLTVLDAVSPAYRGATLDYSLYEAEHAETNGTVLKPSRAYKNPASEASGRSAVNLTETGDYVAFTLKESANRLTIRYAIPDSADGSGLTTSFGLYVNGKKQDGTTLTSRYAWVYGAYPWSNNPADGDAHRFFDESSFDIGPAAAGTEIIIMKEADGIVPYMLIDSIESSLADAPYHMPSGFVSVSDYGAVADDGNDDKAAFVGAMAAARASGKGVWIPAGRYEIAGGPIEIANMTVRGAGKWHTVLAGGGFMGMGDRIRVYDLAIDGEVNARRDDLEQSGFDGAFGTGSTIQHVRIDHTKTGIWSTLKELDNGETVTTEGLYVAGVQIRNTFADGINFSTGTQRSMAEQLTIRNTGDDGMALWASGIQSEGNVFRFNTVELPWLSNNIAVYGGKNAQVTDNVVSDTIAFGAGISVSTRHKPELFEGVTLVARNTLLRTGGREHNWPADFGGLFLFAGDKPMTGDIRIQDNIIRDSTYQGISFLGEQSTAGLALDRNVVDGAGTWGIHASGNISGSALMGNTTVRHARVGPFMDGAAGFSIGLKDQAFNFKSNGFTVALEGQAPAPFVIEAGEQATASLIPSGDGQAAQHGITWSVADVAIATVDADGIVSARRAGETLLVAQYGGERRSYTLIVTDFEAPEWPEGAAFSGMSESANSVTLHWTEAADNTAVAAYRITWDGGFRSLGGDVQELRLSGLAGGIVTTFTLEARDGSGNWTQRALSAKAHVSGGTDGGYAGNGSDVRGNGLLEGVRQTMRADGVKIGEANLSTAAFREALRALTLTGQGEAKLALELDMPEPAVSLVIPSQAIKVGLGELPGGIIQVRVQGMSYELPLKLLGELIPSGEEAAIRLSLERVDSREAAELERQTGVKLRSDLYSFRLFVETASGPVEIHRYGSTFVTREIPLMEAVSGAAATGVVYDEAAGVFRFVPTVFRVREDGTAVAVIRSVTNSLYAVIDDARTFPDTAGHWAEHTVNRMASKRIVAGMGDGVFRPDGRVTRAHFFTMLATALGLPASTGSTFADVNDGDWFAGAIGAAQEYRLASGYENGSVRPNNDITREQLVVLLMRAYRLARGTTTETFSVNGGAPEGGRAAQDGIAVTEAGVISTLSSFEDRASVSSWAAQDMASAIQLGFVQGKPSGQLHPQGKATRAEAAIMLERMLRAAGLTG